MTRWWQNWGHMPKYVTQAHFDAAMSAIDIRFKRIEDRLESDFVTKDEFNTRMDEMMVILRRLDEERVFTIEWIRRIDADVAMIKKHLQLV